MELARRFLEPALDDLADPGLLKDMPAAVSRLRRAIERKERILLYGDYDVDGTSAIVILKKGLDLLGGIASFHVPHRLKDGYDPSIPGPFPRLRGGKGPGVRGLIQTNQNWRLQSFGQRSTTTLVCV